MGLGRLFRAQLGGMSTNTMSMKIPQNTPSAVMMLRLRFRLIVCQISFQRSVSKNLMAPYLL